MALDRSHRIGNVGREKTKWHRSELGNSPCTKPNQIVEFCELHLLFRKVSAAVQWHNESFFFLFDDLWYSEKISNNTGNVKKFIACRQLMTIGREWPLNIALICRRFYCKIFHYFPSLKKRLINRNCPFIQLLRLTKKKLFSQPVSVWYAWRRVFRS